LKLEPDLHPEPEKLSEPGACSLGILKAHTCTSCSGELKTQTHPSEAYLYDNRLTWFKKVLI